MNPAVYFSPQSWESPCCSSPLRRCLLMDRWTVKRPAIRISNLLWPFRIAKINNLYGKGLALGSAPLNERR